MSKARNFFKTPKKTILFIACGVIALTILGMGTVFAASTVAEQSSIGSANACNFAFADAGIDPVSAQATNAEFAFEQGQFVYKIDFTAESTEYEYWIKASDGTVVKKETKILPSNHADPKPTAGIALDAAKEVALADVGLTDGQVRFTKEKLDYDDGLSVYDIEFCTDSHKYEYEIDTENGAVLDKSVKTLKSSVSQTSGGQISLDAAKAKALEDAGLTSSNVTYTKAKLDRDDGLSVYDIEFYTDSHEYKYEIDPENGAVLDKSVKALKSTASQTSGEQIGLDAAKAKALEDAGLSSSDVTYIKAKLDRDDGLSVYDIEFYTDSHEYEYEIDAITGAIRNRAMESFSASVGEAVHSGTYIGVDQAKSIALAHAGFSASDVSFSKAKLENDDGHTVYEIEFYTNGMEYEYAIHAVTGDIMEFDSEVDD